MIKRADKAPPLQPSRVFKAEYVMIGPSPALLIDSCDAALNAKNPNINKRAPKPTN